MIGWLETSTVANWVALSLWAYPALLSLHIVGLAIIVGIFATRDLHLAGLIERIDTRIFLALAPMAWIGFGINLVTGTLFFIGDPMRYSVNIGFQLKMLLIALAGLNVVVHQLWVRPRVACRAARSPLPGVAKLVAATSLLAWTGVLLLGRMIPYVGTG